MKEAADRFTRKEKSCYFSFFDLMSVYSEEEFYSQFATRILKATFSRVAEFIQPATNLMRGTRITIHSGTGEPSLEFGLSYVKDNIQHIMYKVHFIPQAKPSQMRFATGSPKPWKIIPIICSNSPEIYGKYPVKESGKLIARQRFLSQ